MKQSHSLTRRRFCQTLASVPVLAGCAGGDNPAPRRARPLAIPEVAVLLPLSGARSQLGEKMAKAVWLAEDLSGASRRARVLDSGETAEAAAAATRQAVADGAGIIVGPLFRDQTPSVLAAAGDVPVMTLSNDTALADQGAWVFGVTPAHSVAAVLRYADSAGARRITMLETPGTLGDQARAAFAADAKLLPSVAQLTEPAEMAAALRRAGGSALPDIIYVPSASDTALAQAVAAVGTGVTTIGSLQWSGLPENLFSRLDKACFTGPDPLRFDRLSASFRAQLDEDMGVIGALAVDAVAYAQTVGANGKLARGGSVDGLLGPVEFRPDRTCDRTLSVLRIDGGAVVRVA